jgi:hypothetical protein
MTEEGRTSQGDVWVAKQLRSLERGRLAFGLLALTVPTGLYVLFERQARFLDALADHGEIAQATVVGVSRQGSQAFVDYSYQVDGRSYTWDVKQEEAPYPVGQSFPVVYLPEHPTLTILGTDRSKAIARAAANRAFSWKTVAGLFAFFFAVTVLCHVQLGTRRKRRRALLDDPRAYRRRLIGSGAVLVPILALVFGWHTRDALSKGESLWPEVIGLVVVLSILGGTFYYAAREGPAQSAARAARVARWIVPLAMGVAALRLIAWLAGWS